MFRAARIYIQRNLKTGKTEWFFKAREGDFGPFASKEIAFHELNAFIDQCIEKGSDGGRNSGNKTMKSKLKLKRSSVFKFPQ
ncbi:DUF6316 family protein [Methylomicrobium sp. RS1]|jgi:hypothetical protein|uniref:DUF6316 family protein n=1 Tax=Candidatus Methylomicrobium oryzae TaxID=2802053 RepID=UPI001920A576|nr:DUF6316 family protein [Methylomicrobium sp. RS1]MBL1264913.1 hypothetical protein [Methylomicrobium sp. RS1]